MNMVQISASFSDPPDAQGTSHIVSTVIDGLRCENIDLRVPGWYPNMVNAWIAAGNVPDPYVALPKPPVTCALWQLQAVMTADQWSAVQSFIAAMNDPTVAAFFAHGTNQIPSNSTTLAKIGGGIGLTTEEITTLMTQAADVAIP